MDTRKRKPAKVIIRKDILIKRDGGLDVAHIEEKLRDLCQGQMQSADVDDKHVHGVWGLKLNDKQRLLYKKLVIDETYYFIFHYDIDHNYRIINSKNKSGLKGILETMANIKIAIETTGAMPSDSKFELKILDNTSVIEQTPTQSIVPLYEHNGQLVELSDDQNQMMMDINGLYLLNGFAGTGKTLLAFLHLLQIVKKMVVESIKDDVLFCTTSAFLIEESRILWENSAVGQWYAAQQRKREEDIVKARACGLEPPKPLGNIVFIDYLDFIKNALNLSACRGKEAATIQDFHHWLQVKEGYKKFIKDYPFSPPSSSNESIPHTHKSKGKNKSQEDIFATRPEKLYSEFLIMSGYTTQEVYLANITHYSNYKDVTICAWLWDVYHAYLIFLEKNKKYDPKLTRLDLNDYKNIFYKILLDECQNFSPAQINFFMQLAKDKQIFFYGDSNQDVTALLTNIVYLLSVLKRENGTHQRLITTFRSTEKIVKFLNGIFKLRYATSHGTREKHEITHIKSCGKTSQYGHDICLLDPKKKEHYQPDLKQLATNPRFVVIVLNEKLKEKARTELSADMVLTFEEAQGKEWEYVLIYYPFNLPELIKLSKDPVIIALAGQPTEEIIAFFNDNKDIHRPKDGESYVDSYELAWKIIFTICTRATETLLIYQDTTHDNKYLMHLLQCLIKHILTIPNIDFEIPPHLRATPIAETVTPPEKASVIKASSIIMSNVNDKKRHQNRSKNNKHQHQQSHQSPSLQTIADDTPKVLSQEDIEGWTKRVHEFIRDENLEEACDKYFKFVNPKGTMTDFNALVNSKRSKGTKYKIKQKLLTPEETILKKIKESKERKVKKIQGLKKPNRIQNKELDYLLMLFKKSGDDKLSHKTANTKLLELALKKNAREYLFEIEVHHQGKRTYLFDILLFDYFNKNWFNDIRDIFVFTEHDFEICDLFMLLYQKSSRNIHNVHYGMLILFTLMSKKSILTDYMADSLLQLVCFYSQDSQPKNILFHLLAQPNYNMSNKNTDCDQNKNSHLGLSLLVGILVQNNQHTDKNTLEFANYLQKESEFQLEDASTIRINTLFQLILISYQQNIGIINTLRLLFELIEPLPGLITSRTLYAPIKEGGLKNFSLFYFLAADTENGLKLLDMLYSENPTLCQMNDDELDAITNDGGLFLLILSMTQLGREILLKLLINNVELAKKIDPIRVIDNCVLSPQDFPKANDGTPNLFVAAISLHINEKIESLPLPSKVINKHTALFLSSLENLVRDVTLYANENGAYRYEELLAIKPIYYLASTQKGHEILKLLATNHCPLHETITSLFLSKWQKNLSALSQESIRILDQSEITSFYYFIMIPKQTFFDISYIIHRELSIAASPPEYKSALYEFTNKMNSNNNTRDIEIIQRDLCSLLNSENFNLNCFFLKDDDEKCLMQNIFEDLNLLTALIAILKINGNKMHSIKLIDCIFIKLLHDNQLFYSLLASHDLSKAGYGHPVWVLFDLIFGLVHKRKTYINNSLEYFGKSFNYLDDGATYLGVFLNSAITTHSPFGIYNLCQFFKRYSLCIQEITQETFYKKEELEDDTLTSVFLLLFEYGMHHIDLLSLLYQHNPSLLKLRSKEDLYHNEVKRNQLALLAKKDPIKYRILETIMAHNPEISDILRADLHMQPRTVTLHTQSFFAQANSPIAHHSPSTISPSFTPT